MAGDVGPWVLGGVMALLALLGLGLASRAEDDVLYATGLGLFVFCILFIFYLIHRNVGRRPAVGRRAPSAKRAPPAVLSGAAVSTASARHELWHKSTAGKRLGRVARWLAMGYR